MIVLRHGKFISGLRVFRVGDTLPETPSAKNLVEKGMAEIVADTLKKSARTIKKPETVSVVPEKIEPTPENVKSDP